MATDRREILKKYVRKRLEAEVCPGGKKVRGKQAAVARAVGMSSAHISNIISQDRSFGDDFMHALASNWWRIPFSELERLAMEEAGVRMLPSAAPPTQSHALRHHPRWAEMLGKAREADPTIDPQFLEQAGDFNYSLIENLAPKHIITIAGVIADLAASPPPAPSPKPSARSGTRPQASGLATAASSSQRRRRTK